MEGKPSRRPDRWWWFTRVAWMRPVLLFALQPASASPDAGLSVAAVALAKVPVGLLETHTFYALFWLL